MIGDKIELTDLYLKTAKNLFLKLKNKLSLENKILIGIGGESGCGKTTTAHSLKQILEENGFMANIIHQDDYFFLPPKTNHENRLKDIANVGLQEVNFELIKENISDFKNSKNLLSKPIIHYSENKILSEIIEIEKTQILIIEGTYVLNLNCLDLSIFIDRNYKGTHTDRMNRNRDIQSNFIEDVLEIEHQIIKKYKTKADFIIDENFNIK